LSWLLLVSFLAANFYLLALLGLMPLWSSGDLSLEMDTLLFILRRSSMSILVSSMFMDTLLSIPDMSFKSLLSESSTIGMNPCLLLPPEKRFLVDSGCYLSESLLLPPPTFVTLALGAYGSSSKVLEKPRLLKMEFLVD